MKRTPLVAGAIGVVLLLGWWSCRERAGSGDKVSVVVRKAERKDVPIFVEGLGTVQAFNTVLLRARVDGQLVQLSFTEGQDVKAGDLLAGLDARPYQAIVDEAVAKKAQNDAQLANARVVLERNARLLGRKVIDQQSYDTAKLAVDQLEAACQADQAAIDRARTQLDYTQIRSPIDGRTGIRLVDLGNLVLADDPTGIVLITQLQPISIVFTLAEQHLQPVLAGRAAGEQLAVSALDSGSATPLGEGTLTVVDNQIDQATASVKMKAAFPNSDLKLWPGKFVTVRLLLTTKKNAIVVPASAVLRRSTAAYVYVVAPNNRAEMRPVKLAQTQDNEAVIDDGLSPGEQVVVAPEDKLQAGMNVIVTAEPEQQRPQAPRAESIASAATPAGAAVQPTAAPSAAVAISGAAAASEPTQPAQGTPTPAVADSAATPAEAAEATSAAKAMDGSFIIGARDAVVGRKVYFWGREWAKRNGFRGAAAPRRFKGYAHTKNEGMPSCGGTWQHDASSSAKPPKSLPGLITVIATDSPRKSGSVLSGDNRKIVVVKPDRGYRANPARAGTGTIVSVTCE